jgi:hypothetical protein
MQQECLRLLAQCLRSDHRDQGLLRHVAVLLMVVAYVERQEPSNVGKLLLGRPAD